MHSKFERLALALVNLKTKPYTPNPTPYTLNAQVHNKFERLPLALVKMLAIEELHIGQNPLIDVPPPLCTLPGLRVLQVLGPEGAKMRF